MRTMWKPLRAALLTVVAGCTGGQQSGTEEQVAPAADNSAAEADAQQGDAGAEPQSDEGGQAADAAAAPTPPPVEAVEVPAAAPASPKPPEPAPGGGIISSGVQPQSPEEECRAMYKFADRKQCFARLFKARKAAAKTKGKK